MRRLVRDDALQRRDERDGTPVRPHEAVEIDTDDDVRRRRAKSDRDVVEPAVERVEPRAKTKRDDVNVVAGRAQTPHQRVRCDERAAPFDRARRGGGEDGDAHGSQD